MLQNGELAKNMVQGMSNLTMVQSAFYATRKLGIHVFHDLAPLLFKIAYANVTPQLSQS